MIRVLKESLDFIELFNSILKYAKVHKNKFISIKPTSVSFKKTSGTFTVNREGDKVICHLNDSEKEIYSLEEFIDLINKGNIK